MADLIVALVEEDKTILLIDSITNQILTRIPIEQTISHIRFDTDFSRTRKCIDWRGYKIEVIESICFVCLLEESFVV